MVTGSPMRSLSNEFTRHWQTREKEQGQRAKEELQREGLGRGYRVIIEGDMEQGTLPMGQGCGLVTEEKSVRDIIDDIISEAETMYKRIGTMKT
jgi:enoyl-[acyl-carrier protein] reductase II